MSDGQLVRKPEGLTARKSEDHWSENLKAFKSENQRPVHQKFRRPLDGEPMSQKIGWLMTQKIRRPVS